MVQVLSQNANGNECRFFNANLRVYLLLLVTKQLKCLELTEAHSYSVRAGCLRSDKHVSRFSAQGVTTKSDVRLGQKVGHE